MMKFIKKVLASHHAKQAQQRRLKSNHEQLQLIYKGLEMRG